MNRGTVLLLTVILGAGCALPTDGRAAVVSAGGWPTSAASWVAQEDGEAADEEGHGVLYGILVYVPNRILDVLDIVRARVRLGPGLALGARATELADVFVGSYASVYVGLPGPRNRVLPRLPAGLESKSGVEVSAADVTLEAGLGPDYGAFECGFGFQAFIVGVDVGIEPWEILDLVTGLVTVDINDDDF